MIIKTGGYAEAKFRDSPKGSIFNRLYEKNFPTKNEVLFRKKKELRYLPCQAFGYLQKELYGAPDTAEGLSRLFSEPGRRLTYYYVTETVRAFSDYECRLSSPWRSPFPDLLSMVVAKDSPYLPFMRRFVSVLREKGGQGGSVVAVAVGVVLLWLLQYHLLLLSPPLLLLRFFHFLLCKS